jgi:hypothetical protein
MNTPREATHSGDFFNFADGDRAEVLNANSFFYMIDITGAWRTYTVSTSEAIGQCGWQLSSTLPGSRGKVCLRDLQRDQLTSIFYFRDMLVSRGQWDLDPVFEEDWSGHINEGGAWDKYKIKTMSIMERLKLQYSERDENCSFYVQYQKSELYRSGKGDENTAL